MERSNKHSHYDHLKNTRSLHSSYNIENALHTGYFLFQLYVKVINFLAFPNDCKNLLRQVAYSRMYNIVVFNDEAKIHIAQKRNRGTKRQEPVVHYD